jgi:hypothetical protein
VQSPQRFPQLLDLRFGEVFLVFRFGQVLGNLVQVPQHTFQHFLDSFDLGASLLDEGSLLWGQIARPRAACGRFSFHMAVARVLRLSMKLGAPIPAAVASLHTAVTLRHAAAAAAAASSTLPLAWRKSARIG